ncbi:hypothetical protein A374_01174 [Fictibacillus macauensis ZFHKF-1]|uniref:Uncharacterized protein n=1 Tax=Fictibacillus macauensis ZFHKF-1 TaxID=1196324 RepID=I8AMN1_9BACL|nr:hypothetical protein [Fictibacillus macauensis]EIT87252.1 hypothetical protein A374_01174 [Fictibacillus macauensis ZFHKF-1]
MFLLFNTPTEKKRDEYKELKERLESSMEDFNEYAVNVASKLEEYGAAVPHLSTTEIPAYEFEPVRKEHTAKLLEFFGNQSEAKKKLVTAISQAEERYKYYSNMAEEEEAAVKEKLKNEVDKIEDYAGAAWNGVKKKIGL